MTTFDEECLHRLFLQFQRLASISPPPPPPPNIRVGSLSSYGGTYWGQYNSVQLDSISTPPLNRHPLQWGGGGHSHTD